MSHWIYKNEEFAPSEEDLIKSGHYGFVYNITLPNGQMYIGRKYFWSITHRAPLQGKKRRRKIKKESNWRIYKSSSNDVVEMIQKYDDCGVKYEILSFHPNKAETNYSELVHQVVLNVLDEKDSNNEYIYLNRNIVMRYYRTQKHSDNRIELYENIKRSQARNQAL